MYMPVVKSATPKQEFPIGAYTAVLYGDLEQASSIEYLYILTVFDQSGQPCYFVASEVNVMAAEFGGGSHFLGLFEGDRHVNCGSSDNWADEDKFTAEALRLVREKFETHV